MYPSDMLKMYEHGKTLATTIETFNENLYKIRTEDAYELLAHRIMARNRNPEYFPTWKAFCPDSYMIGNSDIKISQTDHISSYKPLIYISKSMKDMKKLLNNLPEFVAFYICYINPNCSQEGVYSLGALFLRTGFTVSTSGDLAITGMHIFPDHNLRLKAKGSLWMIGSTIKAQGMLSISSPLWQNILLSNTVPKPEQMPEDSLGRLSRILETKGFYSIRTL